jgi:LPS-assembly protein
MDRRGLMLGAEYRYLSRLSSGDVFGSWLPDDNQTGDDRYAYSWRHLTEVNRWIASLNYNKVSDDQFLEDFGNTLLASSASHLPQQGRLLYQADNWRARFTLQKYQTIDATIDARNKPYELLPEFNLVGRWVGGPLGLTYHMDGEATSFVHDDKVEGNRLNLYPGVSLPLLRSWGYFLPKVSLSHTQYDLKDNPRGDDDISRTAPVVSVDSGLIFERPLRLLEQDWQQTLEPRLYYLYVPYRNQDDIPLFDTSRASEDYFWMFRENRFTGPDRLGDANQLTLALTSRLLAQGAERARFSFGQIRYFANRRVDLNPNRDPATFSRSDWFAEGNVNVLPGWSVWGSLQWNSDQNQTEVGRVNLRYNPHPGRLVNLAYRFTREERKQLDLATAWRLSERWRLMGRFYYSLRSNKLLEGLAGLEYESCCWTVRAAGRRFRDGADDPSADNAIFFELELKGLGGLGTNLNKVFAESINGYERTY